MSEMSPEEALAAQKANCPFCKMVSGEIPTKKVYEDDLVLAILDINPANKGHVLMMPKEHHYILPLVPPETFKHLFLQAKKLMHAMRKGLIVPGVTLFVANGAAAGQQSPHFLFHLIPREDGDGLDNLDVQERTVKQENTDAIKQNTAMIMRNLPFKAPAPKVPQAPPAQPTPTPVQPATPPGEPTPAPVPTPEQVAQTTPQPDAEFEHPPSPPESPQEKLAALFEMLEQEPALHEMLKNDPTKIEEYAKSNPLLAQAFAGINLQELSQMLKQQEAKNEVVPKATDLDDKQLADFVETKPELKRLLAEDPAGLAAMIDGNERLKTFFSGTTVEAVAERLRPEPIDFDLLAEHLKK